MVKLDWKPICKICGKIINEFPEKHLQKEHPQYSLPSELLLLPENTLFGFVPVKWVE